MKHNPGFLQLVEEARERVKEIDIVEYAALANGGAPHILIDVREESEWGAGHAKGAIALGKGVIERDIESKVPDHATTLVLYCGGGYRSALAADALQRMGYSDVRSLVGGWRAWNEASMPVVKD